MSGSAPQASGRPDHAWERGLPLWHGLFIGLFAIGTVIAVTNTLLAPIELVAVLVLGVTMMTAYWAFFIRRRPWTHSLRTGLVYLALMTAAWAILLRLSASFTWLQMALISQVFFLLPSRWTLPVIAAVVAIGVQWDISQRTGPLADHMPEIAANLAITGFLVVFGAWIGTIIDQSEERHGLIERLEAAQAQLAEQERLAGIQAERQRLARDIHDTIAQDLTAIVMQLRAAGDTSEPAQAAAFRADAERIARDSLAEVRRTVWALRPATLESTSGLAEALGRIVGDWRPHEGVRATFVVTGEPCALHADVEVTLLRGVQEGLANVARHARARNVTVTLAYASEAVTLEIHDDGAGFTPDYSPAPAADSGFGLVAMRARAEQLGGSLAVRSEVGLGTTLGLKLPTTFR